MKDIQTTDMLLNMSYSVRTGEKKDTDNGKGQKTKFCTSVLMDSNESI